VEERTAARAQLGDQGELNVEAGADPMVVETEVASPGDSRGAILWTVERLLESRRLDDLKVVDVINEAGVSRATFYTYFESKHAAVAARTAAIMEQIHELWLPWLESPGPDAESLLQLWLESIALWRRHRPLLMAAAEAWRADALVAEGWSALMHRYAGTVRRHIERARTAGVAPSNPDAGMLATVLVWLNESALYMTFATSEPTPEEDRRLAGALTAMWMRAIHSPSRQSPPVMTPPVPDPPPVASPHVARRRRRGNAEQRRAILTATAELLRDRPLESLTALEVIQRAGVSRSAFYMHFASKHAAVAALADEFLADVYDRLWRRSIESVRPLDPPGTPEHFLETIVSWRQYRFALIAAAEGWRTAPAVYGSWGVRMQSIVDAMAVHIEHAREAGSAACDPDAVTLAELLVWLTETMIYLSLSGRARDLDDDRLLAETMSAVWARAVYGGTR
jgi:TetR/AcrR family transcriptional regulator, ethionamide resistance regulator